MGDKILDRHIGVLEPHTYHLVYKVVNGFLDPDTGLIMLPVLRDTGGFVNQEDLESMPEAMRHKLGRYWITFEERLQEFASLYEWYINNSGRYQGP